MKQISIIFIFLSISLFSSPKQETQVEHIDLGSVIIEDKTLSVKLPFIPLYNEVFYHDTCSISISKLNFNGKEIKKKRVYFSSLEEDSWDTKKIDKTQENIIMYWEKYFDNNYYIFTFLDYFDDLKEYEYRLPMTSGRVEMSYRIIYPNEEVSELRYVTWVLRNN